MIQSEVMIRYKTLYAGTADIVVLNKEINAGIEFDEKIHTYTYKGQVLPSVTELLDDGSFKYVNPEVLKRASDYGTKVHKEIEDYLKEGKEANTETFLEFKILYVKNKELFKNDTIFDIKTFSQLTKKNKEKTLTQMKMYAKGVEYLTGEKITDFYMIWLPRNKVGKIIKLGE